MLAIILVAVILIAVLLLVIVLRRKTVVKLTNDEYNLLAGRKFERFELQSFMARGDINSTYEARDPERNKPVALRVLHRSLSYNDNIVQQFFFKGEMLKYLADRFPGDHFIQNVQYGTTRVFDEPRQYIVSDYIWGVSLAEVLDRYGRLSPRDTVTLVAQIAEAVKLAHSQRIWIRELSPQNIILTAKDTGKPVAVLANIGVPFKSLPSEASVDVKKGYYSPEDRRDEDVDEQSDVFAIAALTFRMLEGYDLSQRKEGEAWSALSAPLESALMESRQTRVPSVDGFLRSLNSILSVSSPVKDLQWGPEIVRILKSHGSVKVKRSGAETLGETAPRRRARAPIVSKETKERVVGGFLSGLAAAFVLWISRKIESVFASPKKAMRVAAIGIVGLAVALWFFVFKPPKTTISVVTDPTGAALVINGVPVGETTPVEDHSVDSGKVSLRIRKVGFFTVDTSIVAPYRQHRDLSLTLHPAANLAINVNPPDALVILDKDTLSLQQLQNVETTIGKHEITITKGGLAGIAREVDLKQGMNPPLAVTLSKGAPRLSVTSDPPGASVFINDVLSGTTPYQNPDIQPGSYRVKIVMDGFEDHAENVIVRTDREDRVEAKLSPAVAFTFTSTPPGADVTVDGKSIGQSPLTGAKITVGDHRLKVKKGGFLDYDTAVTVIDKQPLSIAATLSPLKASAKFVIKPFGTIYVDDKPLAADQTLYNGDLPAGSHTIKVVHPTYGTWQKTETILPKKSLDFTIDFNVFVTVSVVSVDESGKSVMGASITIDGKKTDQFTPGQITQRIGQHTLELKRDGYTVISGPTVVNLEAGQSAPLRFIMKKVQ